MVIYKTTNLINGKIYVGQDIKNDSNYLGSGLLIERAIKKHGREHFKKEIVEVCFSQNELNEKEIYWIKQFNSTNRRIGYNISIGGQGGNLGKEWLSKISGRNNYIHKMTIKEREKHLNTFRRGINYWKSKGFTTIEEIERWIKDNWCGSNHSHKKGKTEEEYKKWLKSTNIGYNFRTKEWKEQMKGLNNPIFRGKSKEEIEQWLNNHRRGKNAPNAKYIYTIVTNNGIAITTECLKDLCKEKNWNLHVLLKFIEMSEGKRKTFVPRLKEYTGWSVKRIRK